MDSTGDFVVTWQTGNFGTTGHILAERFNASGIAQGSAFQVNTGTSGFRGSSSVAMDSAGDFVIAWSEYGSSINAQRYNAAGVAQGSEYVLAAGSNPAEFTAAAMDAAGDFVLAWDAHDSSDSGIHVFAERFNASGVAQGRLSGESIHDDPAIHSQGGDGRGW